MKNILSLTLVQNAYGVIFKDNPFYVFVNEQSDNSGSPKSLKKINQKLADLSILDIQASERWVYPAQPTENGTVNQDTRIRMPIEVSIRIALPTEGGDDYLTALTNPIDNFLSDKPASGANNKMFDCIQTAIKNNYKWTVVTKTKVYENLYLTEMPTEIKPETVNRQIYTLHLLENIIATETKKPVEDKKDEDKGFFAKLADKVGDKWKDVKETVGENIDLIKEKTDGVIKGAKEFLDDSGSAT